MGGKCTVSCEKTGYSATIDFLTKPFYGGKKHQVKGQVFEPGNSKPTCVVNGEWNGVMWADYSSGVSLMCTSVVFLCLASKLCYLQLVFLTSVM